MTPEATENPVEVSEVNQILIGRQLKSKLTRDFGNYTLSKVIPGVMGLLSVMLFVRIAGFEQYGSYSVVLALCMSAGAGLSGWIAQGILRFQSAHSVSPLEFNRVISIATLLSTTAAVFVILVLVPLLGRGNAAMDAAAILLACSFLGYSVVLGQLQATLHSESVLRVEAARSFLAFILPAALAFQFRSHAAIMLVLGLGLAYAIPSANVLFRLPHGEISKLLSKPLGTKRERNSLLKLLGFGWPLAAWFFVIQFLAASDRYFLQRYSMVQAGVYASLYDTVVRSLSLLFSPVVMAVHPIVMRRWNQGQRASSLKVLRTAIRYEVLSFIPVLVAFALCSRTLVRLILGHAYLGADSLVAPLLIGGFLWQLAMLAHKPLEILCSTPRMLLAILVSLSINVVGNLLFIPHFGFNAPAFTGIAAAGAYILMVYVLVPRSRMNELCAIEHVELAL